MERLLVKLLNELENLGEVYEELYDSEVREQMGVAIMEGYVRRTPGYVLPNQFGMYSDDADAAVRQRLTEYVEGANTLADEIGLTSFQERLAAFQNSELRTNSTIGRYYDDFFGHTPPEWYDEAGNVLWDRVR